MLRNILTLGLAGTAAAFAPSAGLPGSVRRAPGWCPRNSPRRGRKVRTFRGKTLETRFKGSCCGGPGEQQVQGRSGCGAGGAPPSVTCQCTALFCAQPASTGLHRACELKKRHDGTAASQPQRLLMGAMRAATKCRKTAHGTQTMHPAPAVRTRWAHAGVRRCLEVPAPLERTCGSRDCGGGVVVVWRVSWRLTCASRVLYVCSGDCPPDGCVPGLVLGLGPLPQAAHQPRRLAPG